MFFYSTQDRCYGTLSHKLSKDEAQEACVDMYGSIFNLTGEKEQMSILRQFFMDGTFYKKKLAQVRGTVQPDETFGRLQLVYNPYIGPQIYSPRGSRVGCTRLL